MVDDPFRKFKRQARGFFWFQNVSNYNYFARAKFLTSALLIFFFAEQSVLLSQLALLTENSLANCNFSVKHIFQIIRNSDPNKAHGHDMISIRILKSFGDSICCLELIFKTFFN